jgi:hypothetical protein
MRVFALRPYHPSAGRVYQPAASPERGASAVRAVRAASFFPMHRRHIGCQGSPDLIVRSSADLTALPAAPARRVLMTAPTARSVQPI